MGRKVRRAAQRKQGTALPRARTPKQARTRSGAKATGAKASPAALGPVPVKACGDFGGRTAQGGPCRHEAGWGTARPGSGPCCEHDPEAAGQLEALKQRVLDGLANPLKHLAQVAQEIGVGATTIYNWRVADPAFDEAVVGVCSARDSLRVHLVDDAWFGRILTGDAPAGTEIFWMKNKAPDRFRDRTELSGPNGAPLAQVHTIMFGDQEIQF
jgi:hypothetical protein